MPTVIYFSYLNLTQWDDKLGGGKKLFTRSYCVPFKNFRMAVKFSTVFGKLVMRKRNLLLQGKVCWKPFCICIYTHTCWQALVVVIRQMTKAMTTTQCHNLVASSNKASVHLGHACSSFAHLVNLKMAAQRMARTWRSTKESTKRGLAQSNVSSPAWC